MANFDTLSVERIDSDGSHTTDQSIYSYLQ